MHTNKAKSNTHTSIIVVLLTQKGLGQKVIYRRRKRRGRGKGMVVETREK